MLEKALKNQDKLEAWESKHGFGDKQIDSDRPLWWKILNLDASHFEWSKYLGKFRIKNLGILRKLAPGLYEEIAEGVKAQQEVYDVYGNRVALGRKVGSIPLVDFFAHPELSNDSKAQDEYFKNHPEFRNK